MKHTPEPWEVNVPHNEMVISGAGFDICTITSPDVYFELSENEHKSMAKEQEANAQRIVDCVNGCEGIKNPLAVGGLLEALRRLTLACSDDENDYPDRPAYNLIQYACREAEQAIAETTKQGA